METKGTTGEETISYWFDLPIDVAEFEEKLGIGAESGDYRIIEKVLPYADEVHEHTSVYQLNELDFMYRQLSSDMQEEYVSLLTVFENLEALYICRNVITIYPDCKSMIDVIALIVFVFLYSGIFTKEYETNTLILILTKGLSRYKVVFAKFFVMFTMWTIGYLLCFAVTYGYNAFFWDNSIAVGLLPAMVHWWLFGVWIIGLIVLFSVLVKSYTGVLLGTGGSVLGVYLISFFPKAWKYTPTTLMESASLLIGTKSIEDYGIAVLITILLVVICLIVSITVMNRKQL